MRTFSVITFTNVLSGRRIIERLEVSDATTNEEINGEAPVRRKPAAVFPVSERYDVEAQEKHAKLFADYMNNITKATREAYEANTIVDILKNLKGKP